MSTIDDLTFFQHVATRDSLTAVARELGLSLPAVSKRLTQLEQRLGVLLVQRTTRRLTLTSEGMLYMESGQPILQQLEELESALSNRQATLRGRLRINGTLGFGRRHLAPIVSSFAVLHPELEISLELSSQPINLLDQDFDIAICLGEPPDSRLIAVHMLDNPRVLCAAPGYLDRVGAPQCVDDLASHNCIVLRQLGSDYALWRFHKDGREYSHKARGNLSSNHGEVAVQLALEGHGLIMRSYWDVREQLANGQLVALLTDYQMPKANIYAVYQHRRHIAQRISAFARYMASELTQRLP
ncbi:LysR family transcriptional regulator [Pseudomonas rhodesiae]|uniref:LysR substrate-binding domain-containing protein n=1 Tax=Pseudomonas rhodesiae TaxID=76760 RepID=UPI001BCDBA64|nr:LysR substrate-binding domain-containing protein [Pseudomonas rhodesiae]QVN04022.1 LysR family transcriptional regulator [Pseudomonas rhodesiae]